VNIDVTVDAVGTDNDAILDEIVTAINEAMSAAVAAETIDADEKISASVAHEESGTSRLVFKSVSSGFTHRMDMVDSGAGLLTAMDINSAVQSAGTAGGFITDVGTTASDSQLNAQLLVDGLTFYRDSNTMNDVLDGVTLTVKDVTETTEALKVAIDSETVKAKINDYLNAYNDVLTYLRAKTTVDPVLKVRGELAGESTYTFLRSNIRGMMTAKVEGVSSGNPEYLFDIGIKANTDGTLTLSDDEKFEAALANGSATISDLFNSADGVANRLKDFLDDYIKVGGILDDSQDSIADRIKSIDGRVERFDARLAKREFQLRQQFAKMQETAQLLSGQQASFASLVGIF
jgi:flagellar hook-associated protein 2